MKSGLPHRYWLVAAVAVATAWWGATAFTEQDHQGLHTELQRREANGFPHQDRIDHLAETWSELGTQPYDLKYGMLVAQASTLAGGGMHDHKLIVPICTLLYFYA
jgi:hypothetical protein